MDWVRRLATRKCDSETEYQNNIRIRILNIFEYHELDTRWHFRIFKTIPANSTAFEDTWSTLNMGTPTNSYASWVGPSDALWLFGGLNNVGILCWAAHRPPEGWQLSPWWISIATHHGRNSQVRMHHFFKCNTSHFAFHHWLLGECVVIFCESGCIRLAAQRQPPTKLCGMCWNILWVRLVLFCIMLLPPLGTFRHAPLESQKSVKSDITINLWNSPLEFYNPPHLLAPQQQCRHHPHTHPPTHTHVHKQISKEQTIEQANMRTNKRKSASQQINRQTIISFPTTLQTTRGQ